MSAETRVNRLNIAVGDQHGVLLPGAKIEFEVEGVDHGKITSSDGHADISRPVGDARSVGVKVTYDGEVQSAKVAPDQNLHTFTFIRENPVVREEPVPTPKRKVPWRAILVVLLVASGAAASVWLVSGSGPKPLSAPVDPIQQQVKLIAETCAGGRTIKNEAEIKSGLSKQLNNLTAASSVSSSDIGAIPGIVKPDDTGLDFYKQYTACLQQQTENYLRLKGVQVVGDSNATLPPPISDPTGSTTSTADIFAADRASDNAIRETLNLCHSRALLNYMRMEQSTEAMFNSIERCRAKAANSQPLITNVRTRQDMQNLATVLDELVHFRNDYGPDRWNEINTLKLSAVKYFRAIARRSNLYYDLPNDDHLAHGDYLNAREADRPPSKSELSMGNNEIPISERSN